jgi:hypothetical protein
VNLSDDDTEWALYCVNELVDRRRRAGVPVLHRMVKLARRLDFAALMSRTGHESDVGATELEAECLIGSREAAAFLGLSTRQVRRLTADLDGEIVGGRLVFRRSTVVEYAEEKYGQPG